MQNEVTIVYPPVIDYKFLYQRPQQLMKALAEVNSKVNTVFINPAHMFYQGEPVYKPFSHLPNFCVVRQTDFARNPNQYMRGKKILWISYGGSMQYYNLIKPDFVVYDSIDKASDEFSHWKQYIPQMERIADIIFASAKVMYDDHKTRFDNVHMLPNGADFEHFAIARDRLGTRPKEFPNSDKIIGYYGAMATWLDKELVLEIAKKYKVVMIGATGAYNEQVQHPNVTVLPLVQYDVLPRCLSWFDITIVPFKLTDMIEGCDPIKTFEYLSAGKPVLTTDMLEVKKYKDVVYVVNKENVLKTIKEVFKENSENKIIQRQDVARNNSWKSRASFALEKIFETMNRG